LRDVAKSRASNIGGHLEGHRERERKREGGREERGEGWERERERRESEWYTAAGRDKKHRSIRIHTGSICHV